MYFIHWSVTLPPQSRSPLRRPIGDRIRRQIRRPVHACTSHNTAVHPPCEENTRPASCPCCGLRVTVALTHCFIHRFNYGPPPVRTGKGPPSMRGFHTGPGSPPCIRGRVPPPSLGDYILRFTPAHTGKRHKNRLDCSRLHGSPPCVRGRAHQWLCRLVGASVHPRAYGEEWYL